MTQRISVVVNTWNEEHNLPWSLGSVKSWADEIILVDMHSSDRTREVAQSFGAKVYLHEWLGFSEPARAFAIEKASGDFVLLLDADEMIPAPLSRALRTLAEEGRYDIVNLARSNYLLGEKLDHTGWGADQDRHLRFFRKGSLSTSATIHRYLHPVAGARIHQLPADPDLCIVHFNYNDVTQFIDKLNRYTSVEAQQAKARGQHETGWGTTRKVLAEIYRRYVKKRGYRDGWRGFYLSLLMALYRVGTDAKLAELNAGMGPDSARARYRQIAEELLRGYTNNSSNS